MAHALSADLKEIIHSLAPAGALILLVRVTAGPGEIYYLTDNSSPITVSSIEYLPFITSHSGFSEDSEDPSDFSITVANVNQEVLSRMRASRGMVDAPVLVSWYSTDKDEAYQVGSFTIGEPVASLQAATFPLGRFDVMRAQLPRHAYGPICTNDYKDSRCKYAGALATCDLGFLTPNGCRRHENTANFRGAPGIPDDEGGFGTSA